MSFADTREVVALPSDKHLVSDPLRRANVKCPSKAEHHITSYQSPLPEEEHAFVRHQYQASVACRPACCTGECNLIDIAA